MCLTSLSRNTYIYIYIYPTVSPELWGFLLRLSYFDTRNYKGSLMLGGAPCFLQVLVTLGSYEGRSEVVYPIFLIIFCLNFIPAISLLWCFNCLRIVNICQYLSSYFLSISTYLKTWLQFFSHSMTGYTSNTVEEILHELIWRIFRGAGFLPSTVILIYLYIYIV